MPAGPVIPARGTGIDQAGASILLIMSWKPSKSAGLTSYALACLS